MRIAPLALLFGGFVFASPPDPAAPADCSPWTLNGYRVGMEGHDVLAVRSVTLHVEGQAQVVQPGAFHGALVLDPSNRLEKWDVVYDDADAEELRAELSRGLGAPVADVAGNIIDDGTETIRQRRTIWRSDACDAAIIVYEDTTARGAPGRSVQATLVRASALPPGLTELKTLFP